MRTFATKNLRFLLILSLLLPALPSGDLQAAKVPKKCIALRDAATPAEADRYLISFEPAANADLRRIRSFTRVEKPRPPSAEPFKASEEVATPDEHPPAAWNCKPVKTYRLDLHDEAALRQQPTLPRPRRGIHQSTLTFDALPTLPGLPPEDKAARQLITSVQSDMPAPERFADAVWHAPAVKQARQQLRPEVQTLLEAWRSYGLQRDAAGVKAIQAKTEALVQNDSQAEQEKLGKFFQAGEAEFKKSNGGVEPIPQDHAHYQALYRNQIVGILPTLDAAQSRRTAELFRNVLGHYKNLDLQVVINLVPENLPGLPPQQQSQIVTYNKSLKKALKQELRRAGAAKRTVKFLTDPA